MSDMVTTQRILAACADDSFDDGIRIDTEIDPLAGRGAPIKPAVYEGGTHQHDRRWATPDDTEPTPVIVIDNVPSQANRLEDAIRRNRTSAPVPELVLDLSGLNLPSHLPKQLSSLQFPHRNADAYLRDARLGDEDFIKTDLGKSIFSATAWECGPLMAWFPQALLYGFWQSHLGKKRQNSKHARAWVSEIVGWKPATTETRLLGMKGDPLNLNIEESVTFDPVDSIEWQVGKNKKVQGEKHGKLSEIGHGQVLVKRDAIPAAVSFARITQRATVSFAQLRRIGLGARHSGDADAAARALLVALGLHAHALAFGRGFALRSGAELRPRTTTATWLGSDGDQKCQVGDAAATGALLKEALDCAKSARVPLDGWEQASTTLTPKDNLRAVVRATWPEFAD